MSSNQRPGKVRVFSSGNRGDVPQRRRGDVEQAEPASEARTAVSGAAAPAAERFPWVVMTLLFLIGCAAGGALLSFLGFFPVVVK
ncbi:hypothetical protein PX699_09280 [Sphingobium sp. H39-3-25]|uniref:hypothetical protein n=1 Tax=Sphingobium arseniciresistens TaxID=3030834 RepID=UPI0023B99DA6|nr:hypothetical protein [Sphingobium arseniciresistens]